MFALHACLAHTAALYARGEAAIVHAVASPYRGRSHFDGQDILESGAARPYARHDGWIGRRLPLLPGGRAVAVRSEEHTSELQSLMRNSYADFCLIKKQQC